MNTVEQRDRLRLGIIFNFSPGWLGGIIYILNLIKTLNYLEDREKPEILVFYQPGLRNFLDEIDYPYLSLLEWSFPSVVKGNLLSWILRKNVFYDGVIRKYKLDTVYPAKNLPVRNRTGARVVAWYADLQHKHYPEFFSRKIIFHRNVRLHFMLRNATDLVVSSKAVKDDFAKFFKLRRELKFHIYHFTSINEDYQEIALSVLKEKYGVPEKYFMVSNQFHKHKNHKVLLEALVILKEHGVRKHLVVTGKFPDAQDSPHMTELHGLIEDNQLHDQISFLGIIPRSDQINLMQQTQAILQPSLFEGWSTVIEDAISLQVPVIASNIPVNMEQLEEKSIYFDPHDAEALAKILTDIPERDFNYKPYEDYPKRIDRSLKLLMHVFRK